MRYKPETSGKTKGFTLIELLVVIAIIALLMSILMPALTKVKRQAQGVLCQSGLRQWALMFNMYAEDYDGSVPPFYIIMYNNCSNFSIKGYWIVALRRYYPPSNSLFFCPTAKSHVASIAASGDINTFAKWVSSGSSGGLMERYVDLLPKAYINSDGNLEGSIGFNRRISNLDPSSNCFPAESLQRQISNVKFAGGNLVPVFGDNMQTGGGFNYACDPPPFEGAYGNINWNGGDETCTWAINRHGSRKEGVTNMSFLDGTVRRVGLKELWTLHWHKMWKEDMKAAGIPDWSFGTGWMMPFKDYAR